MLGGVFISYRREDSGGFAGRIYDRLTNRLGRESVFFDVDNIPPGMDFVDVLTERVGACDALVAVIGKRWISATDKNNQRRLDDPHDFVRIEIQAALERGVRVIPVLVEGAAMPKADDLPDSLKKLARRQGIEISHNRFDSDVERLTRALAMLEEELRQREAAEGERAARAETEAAETAERERPRAKEETAKEAATGAGPREHKTESDAAEPAPDGAAHAEPRISRSRRGGWKWAVSAGVASVAALGVATALVVGFGPRQVNPPLLRSNSSTAPLSEATAGGRLVDLALNPVVQPEQTTNAAAPSNLAKLVEPAIQPALNAAAPSNLAKLAEPAIQPALNAAARPEPANKAAAQANADGDPLVKECERLTTSSQRNEGGRRSGAVLRCAGSSKRRRCLPNRAESIPDGSAPLASTRASARGVRAIR